MATHLESVVPMEKTRNDLGQELHAIEMRQVVTLACNGLVKMFDPQAQLFCYSLQKTETGLAQEGISRRYTMMSLMGLHRLRESGVSSPIETEPVLEGLLANVDWVDNIGDMGLLLWVCALIAPDRLSELETRLDLTSALTRYREVREGRTMHLAWFLAGLSHSGLVLPENTIRMRDLAFKTYDLLKENQGRFGFFGHMARNRSVLGRLRGWIGSFADQVYPIYAMTKLAQAYEFSEALDGALDCALRLCEVQGDLGQWWWHYDSSTGKVLEQYPVFSVHQHGMGPMTLFELGETAHYNFNPSIFKGLQWIDTNNELGFDMKNASAGVIWRSMFRSRVQSCWDVGINLGTKRVRRQARENVKVLFECRPYELGWLLYAFAGRAR